MPSPSDPPACSATFTRSGPARRAFSVCALLAVAACAGAPATPSVRLAASGVYPTAIPVERPDGTWQVCRVVDGITGRPIAGAELFLIEEAKTPLPGEFRFLASARSDADGFVAVESSEHPFSWILLRAPGYGPSCFFRGLETLVWPLAPGIDVPVQVCDWLDRPVPGAGIGFCIGCGHTPDVRNAVADERGIAILRDIDPHTEIADIYPQHRGLGIDNYHTLLWCRGDPPARVRAPLGLPVHGRLLDPRGEPVTSGFVGTRSVHRGPWTRIQPDGSFRLDALPRHFDLYVVLGGHEYVFEVFEDAWREPITLQLPVANDEPSQFVALPRPEGREGRLLLRFEDAAGRPETDLEITCVGPLPLRHRFSNADDDWVEDEGLIEVGLVAGTYEVHCSGKRHVREIGRVEVVADRENRRTLRPVPLPTLRLDVPADCWSVELLCRGVGRNIADLAPAGAPVPVPIGEDFGFSLQSGDDHRIVAIPAAVAEAAIARDEALKLRFLSPTVIRARLIDTEGEPATAHVALLTPYEADVDLRVDDARDSDSTAVRAAIQDGRVELASRNVGLHFLAVRPDRKDLRPVLLPIFLPARGEDVVVDLGRIELTTTPRLRIVTASGTPYAGTPGFLRNGWYDLRNQRHGPSYPVDAEGGWLGVDPRAGDAIVVPGGKPFHVPFRTVLEGPGPWTITVPSGQVQVDARDQAGEPLGVSVFVADREYCNNGPVLLHQLPAGDTELVVTAPGHRTAFARVTVPVSGRADLRLVLPPE